MPALPLDEALARHVGWAVADAQQAELSRLHLLQFAHRVVVFAPDAQRALEQRLPGGRRLDAARMAREEPLAGEGLEASDGAAQRRLRQSQRLGRAPDVALLGDDQQVLDVVEFHYRL